MVKEIIGLDWDDWVKLNFELKGKMDACWRALVPDLTQWPSPNATCKTNGGGVTFIFNEI